MIAAQVLRELPDDLLRYPLRLLAQPGLTQAAYTRAGSVLRCGAEVAPSHLTALLDELQERVAQIGTSLEQVGMNRATWGKP